jgi:hypothetical protein
MKLYLLIAGYDYYPRGDTQDWVKTFETYEEAEQYVSKIEDETSFNRYKLKNGDTVDWYTIVDLKKWIE